MAEIPLTSPHFVGFQEILESNSRIWRRLALKSGLCVVWIKEYDDCPVKSSQASDCGFRGNVVNSHPRGRPVYLFLV